MVRTRRCVAVIADGSLVCVLLIYQLKILGPWKIVQLDTSDEQSILDAAASLASVSIDLLINNAGVLERAGLEATTKASMMRHFEINVTGPFLTTRAFLPNLKLAVTANGAAFVAQITSWLSSITDNSHESGASELIPPGSYYGYRASKVALNMVNKSLSVDLKDEKIGCLLLHPGYVATDMTGHKGEMSSEQCADALTKIIAKVTLADTGKFYHWKGHEIKW